MARWFLIIESQFTIARITNNTTKFHTIIANLPVSVLSQLSDEAVSCNDYDQLKAAIVALYSRSDPELFDKIVSKHNIPFQKPTQYLSELQELARESNLGISDNFIKVAFLKGLPNNISHPLIAHPATNLDELARVGDTLL